MEQKVEQKLERKWTHKSECTVEDDEPHLTPHLKRHYELEAEILRLLLDLEVRFREYYDLYQCKIKDQDILVERIWLLTQRYLILISSEQGCQYPEVYTRSTEEAIINEYQEKLEVLRTSNNILKTALMSLSEHCKQFYAAYDRLDKTQETPFILGDKNHRCIQHHKIMAVDIFNYFYAMMLKLKCHMHQLDPMSPESVEEYRQVLQNEALMEEFEDYLTMRFVYCRCLMPAQTCPILKLKCSHKDLANLKYVSRI